MPRSAYTMGLCCDSMAKIDDWCEWKHANWPASADCGSRKEF